MANRFLGITKQQPTSFSLEGFNERQRARVTQREREDRKNIAEERFREGLREAEEISKPINIAKDAARAIGRGAKELAVVSARETVGVLATVPEIIQQPFTGRTFEPRQFLGGEVKTVGRRAEEAGQQLREGEITKGQAAGELGMLGLDVVTTFAAPIKGLKIFRGGKLLKGAVEGGTIGVQYGALYGLAGAAREEEDLIKGTITGAGVGLGLGFTLGAGTGLVGKVFGRKAALKENPDEFIKLIGKDKNLVDYLVTRPNLRIMERKLGKDIPSKLEWNYKRNEGILLLNQAKATDEVMTHAIGQYLERMNPDIGFKFQDEIAKIAGKGKPVDEAFAFSVSKLMSEPLLRIEAPELAKFLEIQKLILPELGDGLVKQGLSAKAIDKLPELDKKDFLKNIKPKLNKLRKPKSDEVLAIQTGDSPFVDTDIKVALNRGTNQNTKIEIIKKTSIKKPDKARAARGERLLKKGEDLVKAAKAKPTVEKVPTAKAKKTKKYKKSKAQTQKETTKKYTAKIAKGQVEKVISKFEKKPLAKKKTIKSKLGLGVRKKATKAKIIAGFDRRFRDLPEYNRVNMKEQGIKAVDQMVKDIDASISMAMGTRKPPKGILPESMFVAVEDYAIATGDVDLLRRLATESNLISEATSMGQRIRTLAERNPESAVRQIQEVSAVRTKNYEKKTGESVAKAKDKVVKQIEKKIKSSMPTKKDWLSFIQDIKC